MYRWCNVTASFKPGSMASCLDAVNAAPPNPLKYQSFRPSFACTVNDGQFHPHAIPEHVWCTSQDHSSLLIGGEGDVGRGEGGSEVGAMIEWGRERCRKQEKEWVRSHIHTFSSASPNVTATSHFVVASTFSFRSNNRSRCFVCLVVNILYVTVRGCTVKHTSVTITYKVGTDNCNNKILFSV